jgi:hypothetical protein
VAITLLCNVLYALLIIFSLPALLDSLLFSSLF